MAFRGASEKTVQAWNPFGVTGSSSFAGQGQVRLRLEPFGPCLYVRPVGHQKHRDLATPPVDGRVKGRLAAAIGGIHVRALLQKEPSAASTL